MRMVIRTIHIGTKLHNPLPQTLKLSATERTASLLLLRSKLHLSITAQSHPVNRMSTNRINLNTRVGQLVKSRSSNRLPSGHNLANITINLVLFTNYRLPTVATMTNPFTRFPVNIILDLTAVSAARIAAFDKTQPMKVQRKVPV